MSIAIMVIAWRPKRAKRSRPSISCPMRWAFSRTTPSNRCPSASSREAWSSSSAWA